MRSKHCHASVDDNQRRNLISIDSVSVTICTNALYRSQLHVYIAINPPMSAFSWFPTARKHLMVKCFTESRHQFPEITGQSRWPKIGHVFHDIVTAHRLGASIIIQSTRERTILQRRTVLSMTYNRYDIPISCHMCHLRRTRIIADSKLRGIRC